MVVCRIHRLKINQAISVRLVGFIVCVIYKYIKINLKICFNNLKLFILLIQQPDFHTNDVNSDTDKDLLHT